MKRIVLLLIACVILLCIGSTGVLAADIEPRIDSTISIARASDYLASYNAWTSSAGSGNLRIEFIVKATERFPNVGVLQITVQEKQGTSWTSVKNYYSATTSGMMGSNTNNHAGSIVHSGIPGTEYRALVTVYAGDSSGSDQRVVTTNSTIV